LEEVKYFMTILGPRDYTPISRHIPGFPLDMKNPRELKKQIEAALLRSFMKPSNSSRRRPKSPQLDLRELYQKVGTDLIEKTPRLDVRGDFNAFILTLASYPKLKPYQQISLIYTLYENEFDDLLQRIMNGSKEGKGILDCFPSSPYDRVHSLLRVGNEFVHLIPWLQGYCQEMLPESPEPFEDIEQLYSRLQASELFDERLAHVAQYLIENERYNDEANAKLVTYVISRSSIKRGEESNLAMVHALHKSSEADKEVKKLQSQLNEALIDVVRLKEQHEAHLEIASTSNNNAQQFMNEIQSLTNDKDKLQDTLRGLQQQLSVFADLTQYIDTLKGSTPFLYVCKHPEFIASLFRFDSAYTSDVVTWGRAKWTKYKDAVVCVNRSSLSQSKDWLALEKTMEKYAIRFFTVTGYEELGCVQQIITYMIGADLYGDEHDIL
jgi:hypothetical protein